MVDLETSNSKSEVMISNSWKITSFSITTSLQRESFLTMFYNVIVIILDRLKHVILFDVNFYILFHISNISNKTVNQKVGGHLVCCPPPPHIDALEHGWQFYGVKIFTT